MDIHTHQFAPTEKTLRSCQNTAFQIENQADTWKNIKRLISWVGMPSSVTGA